VGMTVRRTIYAYLLWLPPLGWLGLHQYYLGRHYHAVWLFTTFAGFFVGWLRDLKKIPTYATRDATTSAKMVKIDDAGCCCGICTRLRQCIRNCLSRFWGGRKENGPTKDHVSKKDLSDEDLKLTSQSTEKVKVQKVIKESTEAKIISKKIIEELVVVQLRNEFGSQPPDDHTIQKILQVQLRVKIEELTEYSLSTNAVRELLQSDKPIDEKEVKQRLEPLVKYSLKDELAKIVQQNNKINPKLTKTETVPKLTINNDSLKVMDNFERIFGAFLTARYYRVLVAAALSDYLVTGWITHYLLKLLPSMGMMCGVYLVSNIGEPPRLTLRALFLSGLVAHVVFEVVALSNGKGSQTLACLVCTVVAVSLWQWPKSTEQSSKYSCVTVTTCACVVMMLVYGSIVMNTTIEVDGRNVTISEALHNFYNSPAWLQMKEALWDTLIMYLEGNWDEANETLLKMSDLSGAERALSVLGLPRDADEATIKAQYKKLAREWHPDKYQGKDKEAASNKFIEIQQAYTLLTKKIKA